MHIEYIRDAIFSPVLKISMTTGCTIIEKKKKTSGDAKKSTEKDDENSLSSGYIQQKAFPTIM